jgi:hypothetical protein
MKRWLATFALTLLCVLPLAADVTIVTTTTLEGPMMAMAGGGANLAPKIVTRIKGSKSRTEVEMGDQLIVTLMDLTTKEAILLRPADKTAQALNTVIGEKAKLTLPTIDSKVKPTGKTREISGQQCDEYTVEMRMDMASMTPNMPPEAATMLKDVRMMMGGMIYVAKGAPGVAEYQKFQASAAKVATGALSGLAGGSQLPAGMEKMMTGFAEAPGIPYLTELTLTVEGSGPMVEMMKKMGQMKMISRVTSVTTDALADTLFKVPDDYKMIK